MEKNFVFSIKLKATKLFFRVSEPFPITSFFPLSVRSLHIVSFNFIMKSNGESRRNMKNVKRLILPSQVLFTLVYEGVKEGAISSMTTPANSLVGERIVNEISNTKGPFQHYSRTFQTTSRGNSNKNQLKSNVYILKTTREFMDKQARSHRSHGRFPNAFFSAISARKPGKRKSIQ